jgi:hypothetical protein
MIVAEVSPPALIASKVPRFVEWFIPKSSPLRITTRASAG